MKAKKAIMLRMCYVIITMLILSCTSANKAKKETITVDFSKQKKNVIPFDMLKREFATVDYVRKIHPKFSDIPFLNDEADPLAGWARNFWWRKGAWYAAFVSQNIDVHQKKLIDSAKVQYTIQSNDHTFMGDWHARATHALLFNPADSTEYRLVPKPVLSVMHLISQLGDTHVDVEIPKNLERYFGVMASLRGRDSVVVMLYNKTDFDPNTHDWDVDMPAPTIEQKILMEEQELDFTLSLQNLPFDSFTLARYQIDSEHTDPHEKWLEMGSPEYPSEKQYKELLFSSKPDKIVTMDIEKTDTYSHVIAVNLPSPSVSFLILNRK